ncbi:MAG: radical SAM protein [Desulfobacterales bacterium]|nr:radical SAM protein [Desulfobacterales bacterium]MBF0396023.1 radical SAM protein [Desulfobacterales bacterium]
MRKETALELLRYRIFSFYNEAKQIKNGIMPRPRVAIYHPTYVCNHNCSGCDFRFQNKEFKVMMTREQNLRIISQIISSKVEGVEFAGGGEPLLHPFIVEDVEKLSKAGISVSLITNGSFLKEDILKTFIENGTYIRISLESGCLETFKQVKGITKDSEYENIINNIRSATEMRAKLNKDLDISIKFTVGRNNFSDMEKGIKLSIDLGVDSIQFKLYENVDKIGINEDWDKGSQNDLENIQLKLSELKVKYRDKITIIGNLKKTQIEGKCWLTPIITIIDAFGDVYLCPYYRHRMESHKLGNLMEKSFDEIWFAKSHWDAITNIKTEKCDLYDCRFHIYSDLMSQAMDEKKNYLKFI